jgi:hypothetical protein
LGLWFIKQLSVQWIPGFKMAVFWDVAACSLVIALKMEAINTSETSENFCQATPRNIPEDNHIYACRPENLKSH